MKTKYRVTLLVTRSCAATVEVFAKHKQEAQEIVSDMWDAGWLDETLEESETTIDHQFEVRHNRPGPVRMYPS